ncbi:hypothetical protein UFOVP118_71 [uncultured Caudovirales phage]|uniref:Uncharacterized protein n=1 Tax=uncultured Caudovirales phage TaxID=2100421 RepID=A0A6J5L7Y3_9CAUD|nr:hypothetical protein UFOVP118_71 [uncultured Caudovirales phage]
MSMTIDGTSGVTFPNSSVQAIAAPSGALINTQYFTTAGTATYTPTAGTNFIIVDVQGAGAGGTSGNGTGAGPSGGAGAYARKKIPSGFSGTTVTVGTGTAPNLTTTAGTSSFGAFVTCTGGSSISTIGSPSLVVATATGGDFNQRGCIGNGGGSSGSPGVPGGWSIFGGAAGYNQSGIYGGGGGNNGVGTCTASGGNGIVVVYEYA